MSGYARPAFWRGKPLRAASPSEEGRKEDESHRREVKTQGSGGLERGKGGGSVEMEKLSGDRSPEEESPAGNDKSAAVGGSGGRAEREDPPDDDVCPICFGEFTVPCKSVCGHWYCASCILTYWSYNATPRPCKCPMCSCNIHRLIPQESLLQLHDEEVNKVLKEVQSYNLLFVGGIRGAVQKARQVPCCIKRYLQRFFTRAVDPDRMLPLYEMRLLMTFVIVLYGTTPLQYIPTGGVDVIQHMHHIGFIILIILRLTGLALRWLSSGGRARARAVGQPHED
ncbi:hypothetical protein SAY87_018782 [Trapa incisa]|uniref:RING-type domain-containing protein n=1 Tax=Trapa incisa TaxID=236973 RepID=A0AAN7K0G7_9MYRT|nr:hypothetical protein SAY87_018782 [Trapa incisa]